MTVVYHSRNRLPLNLEQGARYFASFHDMLPHCDFLSLHAPANPVTDKIINAEALAKLQAWCGAGERLARRPGR